LKNLLLYRFITRHWAGGFSVAVSYWLIGFAVTCTSLGAGLSAKYLIRGIPYDPVIIFAVSTSTWLAMLSLLIWHLVGTWRSATRANTRRRVVSWANLAKVMLVLGAVQFARVAAAVAVPQTIAIANIAFNGDSDVPDYHLTLSEADSEITVDGGVKYGLARDLEKLLQTAPAVRVINFNSIGGRVGEAYKLFQIISERHLDTVTNNHCLSACTVAFAGGTERWVGPYARLGFHSAQFVAVTSAQIQQSETRIIEAAVLKNHTPRQFYTRVQAVSPSDMWYPTRQELLDSHIITQPVSRAPSTLRIINASLRQAMQKLNATLPKHVDEITTLVASRVAGSDFTYVYELSPGSLPAAHIPAFSRQMSAQVTKAACGIAAMKTDIESGVTYSYEYFMKGNAAPFSRYDVSVCPH
jgi:hypothetical protein